MKKKAKKCIIQHWNTLESKKKYYLIFSDYSSIVLEAKYKTFHGDEIKIWTPKRILQKLPIAFAQVKAGNTSENSLNETRQIIYSLYRAK